MHIFLIIFSVTAILLACKRDSAFLAGMGWTAAFLVLFV